MSFAEILVKNNVINGSALASARQKAEEADISLEEALLEQGVYEQEIVKAKSEAFSIPVKEVSGERIPFEVLQKIPEESVRHYKFVPLSVKDGAIEIGVINPDDTDAREALQFLSSKLNMPLKIFLISRSDFEKVLEDYKSLGGEAVKILDELETVIAEKTIPKDAAAAEKMKVEETFYEQAPITKMVAVILRHAIDGEASDVHIEPLDDILKVRFRVDGVLHTSLKLPTKVHDAIISRIKILTNMKLDEKRRPQDGRFETKIGGRHIDFRVSTFPTFFGEKVVIRILDPEKGVKDLEATGVVGRNLEIIKEALKRPYGLILLTGPTGSGKTTTLYAMLRQLDREKNNVVSLEDPIEYNLEGVSQSQVRPEIDYDFANGLRSIFRQDPDVIMVGEIRDKETARLAIQAALTGHLVFSTLHTNNAIGIIPRLIDMSIDPFLISATLLLGIAQRLARTLCPGTGEAVPLSGKVKEIVEKDMEGVSPVVREKIKWPKEIRKAEISAQCPQGTRGRVGIFEVLKMTPELEQIILTNPSEAAIMKESQRQGMLTMRQDGILKVLNGQIGLEQLREVI